MKHIIKPSGPGRITLAVKGLIALAALAVLCVGVYGVGRLLEKNEKTEEARGEVTSITDTDHPSVTYDGQTYSYRRGLTTILMEGVDRTADAVAVGARNGGQADFLLLLVIDKNSKQVTPIQIDRDTMTPITILGVLGNAAGTRVAQISLSHGFGDGKAQSSLFTVQAVSELLQGVSIDFYMTLNMDGISTLNDALGGVTVTLEDDFSAIDPTMTAGTTLTLQGEQAETFVRSRMDVGVGTNEARMARQKVYMAQASEILRAKLHENANFAGTLFDTLGNDLLTNIKRGRLINEAWAARDFAHREVLQLQGEHRIGEDGFMEFHADEDALVKLVLDVFYQSAV